MKISTRGRYALRMMMDLAMTPEDELVTLKSIAARQAISEKYLEQIVTLLSRADLVRSTRGAQGGYRLNKPAREYTVGMILRAIEGSLAPVECLQDDPNRCARCDYCAALDVWKQVQDAIDAVVDGITLESLAARQKEKLQDFASSEESQPSASIS